jgi:hypothetical protein
MRKTYDAYLPSDNYVCLYAMVRVRNNCKLVTIKFAHNFLCIISTGTDLDHINCVMYDLKVSYSRHICVC